MLIYVIQVTILVIKIATGLERVVQGVKLTLGMLMSYIRAYIKD